MRDHVSIPCLLMRGGTSKGPYFHAADLPTDPAARDRLLLAVMGSPDLRQIDGLGGADSLTSKVAIISKSTRPGVDVDYLFAQVDIAKAVVDTSPSCGNMLSGVGPYAIENAMVQARPGTTTVIIFDVNTSSRIEAVVQTPDVQVTYAGDAAIDGVPGTAAPVILNFLDAIGAKTGQMLPTGHVMETIEGLDVSCLDAAMPMVLMRATDLGLDGAEGRAAIDSNAPLLARIEAIRMEAGRRMGFGDVTDKVIPKVGLLSPPRGTGAITSRYLTPHKLHSAHAVTGAVCVATAVLLEGSVAYHLATRPGGNPCTIWIEHPSGMVDVRMETAGAGATMQVLRAGILRTCRPIMQGNVLAPLARLETAALPLAAE